MRLIRLIHWSAEECPVRANELKKLGFRVIAGAFTGTQIGELRNNPPHAVVIDLSRLPGRGREVAVYLRLRKATRLIPLVFVEGEPEKVAKVKSTLPDARYTTYTKIGPVLEDVIANPPGEAFVPQSQIETAAPLSRKLGVKDGAPIALFNAPDGFESLVPGVECLRGPKAKASLSLWFVETRKELQAAIPKIRRLADVSGVWIIWPKQSKTAKPDVNGNLVRELALAAGLVDFKICAVDQKWSAMRFAVKR